MVNFRDQLYAFPQTSNAERYDPVCNGWSKYANLCANSAMVTVVKGQIYGIKVNLSTEQSTISRYNVELCSWETVLSSHQGCREEPCLVTAGNHLYVIGGKPPGASAQYVAKAERFDTVENKWEEIADMQRERGCAFGVATEGKIFVAGGGNKERKVSLTCEMYNVSTNEWQFIGSLNDGRVYGACMVCMNGTLYVLGGIKSSTESVLTVECYDPTEDKWIRKTTIPVENISKGNKDTFTGCVLKLSKGVLDKLNLE